MSDGRYTYRIEYKPMKSNVYGGWVPVVGYSSRTKEDCEEKKTLLVDDAIKNKKGLKFRVRENRVAKTLDDGWRSGL